MNPRSTKELTGYGVQARDGAVGSVREVYFDDSQWRVKYLVVETGRWLPKRRILLPLAAVRGLDSAQRRVLVALTREEVRSCPEIDTDRPVVLQRRAERRAQRDWALPLAGEALGWVPESLQVPVFEPINKNGKPFDPHLRTTRVVIGLGLQARDGLVGRIADLIIDEGTWTISYLVVERRNGGRIAVRPALVKEIVIEERVARTDFTMGEVGAGVSLDSETMRGSMRELAGVGL